MQNPGPLRDISQDPDYQSLLAESQLGHWRKCVELLSILDEKYPGNPKILEFKKDFELQVAILNNIKGSAKNYVNKKVFNSFKSLIMIAGAILVVSLIVLYVANTYLNNVREKQRQVNANQINVLSDQVEVLLNSGHPEKAQELVQQMVVIDPTSPKTIELTQKTEALLKINSQYMDAIDKLDNGLNSEALILLMNIESEYPGYKDVPQLIESTNSKIKLAQALRNGNEAYKAGNWQVSIDNFEQVLTLDPNNSDSNLKEMLATSYLRRTIQLLENDTPTLSEIDQAELYYNRAVGMIPQLKVNSSELEDLKRESDNSLELKLTQAADQMIKDPAQTSDSVNQAFTYLEKALALNPQNNTIRAEIEKANLYRSGFKFYVAMSWQAAIQQLSSLTAIDESYANGFARQILYEAYIGQGIQYYSAGSYLSAKDEYESAVSLVSGKDYLLNLYLAEINLGRTLGKLNQFNDADSNFIKAIESIDYEKRAQESPTFMSGLNNAVALYKDGQYEKAYNLFDETLAGSNSLYGMKKIIARQGNCLALIAAHYQSSVQAILGENNLPQQTILVSDQELNIPFLP